MFKVKKDENGNITKLKTRVVAQGNFQIPDSDEHYLSPVVDIDTLRYFFSQAPRRFKYVHQTDVAQAFLLADLHKPIYITLPDIDNHRYKRVSGTKVYALHKSLYGLREANRLFYELLHSVMISIGFERLKTNLCVYAKHADTDKEIYICCYVDDSLIFTNSPQSLEDFKNAISTHLDITDFGEAHHCLGITIKVCVDKRVRDIKRINWQ